MSNREKCIKIIEKFPDDRLTHIAAFLESAYEMISEALDDACCVALNDHFLEGPDKDEPVPIETLAEKWGISGDAY